MVSKTKECLNCGALIFLASRGKAGFERATFCCFQCRTEFIAKEKNKELYCEN